METKITTFLEITRRNASKPLTPPIQTPILAQYETTFRSWSVHYRPKSNARHAIATNFGLPIWTSEISNSFRYLEDWLFCENLQDASP